MIVMFDCNAVSFYVVLQVVKLVFDYVAAKMTDMVLGFAICDPMLYSVFC